MSSNPDGKRNISVFAWTSLLNDIASEATLRLLPLFLSQVLGTGPATIGLIEGVADSTATLTKLVSGWISDRLPRRKPLVVAGYALSGITKPFLLLATTWWPVLLIRFADRLGKGVRSAPRDALVADSVDAKSRGRAFGLISALDTVGAFVGLLIAFAVVQRSGGGERLSRSAFDLVVIIATVPALLAVAVIALGAREDARQPTPAKKRFSTATFSLARLPKKFWRSMTIFALFTLANSSDAFLILKAARSGVWAISGAPFALLCLLALNVVQAALASPAGRLSDRVGRRRLLLIGWLIYAVTYAGFALVREPLALLALFGLYGSYYGFTEGAQRSLVADLVTAESRGLAYGVFSFMTGLLALPASLLFGILSARYGDGVGFAVDAAAALAACAGLALVLD